MLDQLEGDLGAAGDLLGELPRGLLDKGGERVVERAVVHARRLPRRVRALLPHARVLAVRRACYAAMTTGVGLVGRLRARALGAQPLLAVGAHRLDDRDERAALGGERVLDARRDLGERLALDDALLLQRAQAQREGARGDALERALELAEAEPALREVTDHEHRPLAAHDVGGPADWAVAVRHRASSYRMTSLTEVESVRRPSRSSVPRTTVSASSPPARAQRVEQVVDAAPAARPPAATRRSPRSRPAAAPGCLLHLAHEQPVALGQPDRGAHPARGARRREREAEARVRRRLAAGQRVDALAQRRVGREREHAARPPAARC